MNFWQQVNKVISESDIVLEIVDSRFPELSRNQEIEDKVQKAGKKLLIVYNKSDLSNPGYNLLAISTKKKLGTTRLKRKILEAAKGKDPVVGVVGYPNTGKSSVINALAGKNKARASSESGYTKNIKKIRAGRILMLDTPGVIPYENKDEAQMALIGAKDSSKLDDPETAAELLIKDFGPFIQKHYGSNDLEKIAVKLGKLKKGAEPDLEAVSRTIIRDWQKGKILLD